MVMLSPVPDADRHAPRAVLEADLQQLVLRPAPAPAQLGHTGARGEHRQARGHALLCGYPAALEYLHIYFGDLRSFMCNLFVVN